MDILQIDGLVKHYASTKALDNVSFSVGKGEICGLLGPNGAGKTTLLRIINNLLVCDAGTVTVNGIPASLEASRHIGYMPEERGLYDKMRVEDQILYFGQLKGGNKARLRVVMGEYMEIFNLTGQGKRKVKELSKGMQMKLMVACAFSYDAKLLILDEPTSGLDPVSRDELLKILSEYIEDGEHSVLFSTHITSDLERAADYITYINYGELFFSGSKDEFVEMFRLVKGGRDELTLDLSEKLIGIRKFSTGFEGLIKSEDLKMFSHLDVEPATIDDIVVFTNQEGDHYE